MMITSFSLGVVIKTLKEFMKGKRRTRMEKDITFTPMDTVYTMYMMVHLKITGLFSLLIWITFT